MHVVCGATLPAEGLRPRVINDVWWGAVGMDSGKASTKNGAGRSGFVESSNNGGKSQGLIEGRILLAGGEACVIQSDRDKIFLLLARTEIIFTPEFSLARFHLVEDRCEPNVVVSAGMEIFVWAVILLRD